VSHRLPSDLSELLRGLAARHDRPAVAGEHRSLTFAALDVAADEWAAAFRRAGFGRGSHIGLLAGNGPEWLATAFGVWRAGATLVPISTFVTARELAVILDHADVSALVVQPQLRSRDHLDLLRHVPPLPRLRQVFHLKDATPESPRRATAGEESSNDPDSIACILYTSGTSGQPKGVMLSHRAILATVLPTAERSGLTNTDALLSTLPLFWVAGLVIRALPTLASGCTLLLVETFTTEAVMAALRRHRPSGLHLRPPQVGQVLAHTEFTADLLATVRKGGGRAEWYAPYLDPRTTHFITGYGMTEMAGYVTALHWQDSVEARRDQMGAPLPGVEMRIVDAAEQPCASGTVGEIRVRGPGMFSGYYKQPSGTGLDRNGFLRTGDLGYTDAAGTLHFVGRSKDLLRIKGINVSPLEVEAVLSTHPAVEAAYVVGLPPDGLEQRLTALIIPKPGEQVTESALRALSADALSHYKRPEAYVFINRADVPLSGTAKPQRAALAVLAAQRLSGAGTVARSD